jgi:hypothetical protein
MKTKYLQHLAILTTSALLFPVGALARDGAHSVEIPSTVQIGSTHLKAGDYKVAWQGTGPVVQVTFQQNGKTVATLPATLKMNDDQARQDAIMTEGNSADGTTLKEIDFGHQREALVFDQSASGM